MLCCCSWRPNIDPGINARVLNRFGDGVLVRGRQLRQIQAAEHLQAGHDAQRLETREHWLELAANHRE